MRALIIIVPPNRVAVITGRTRRLPDRSTVGYRSVIGGRTLRIPILESLQCVNLETIPIEITVSNAFERLLGKTDAEFRALVKDTLMGTCVASSRL